MRSTNSNPDEIVLPGRKMCSFTFKKIVFKTRMIASHLVSLNNENVLLVYDTKAPCYDSVPMACCKRSYIAGMCVIVS